MARHHVPLNLDGDQVVHPVLGKFTPAPSIAPRTLDTHIQRSAVASLVGRCEGLIWDHDMLPETERKRLFALLEETCAAFDMAPPKMEREPV